MPSFKSFFSSKPAVTALNLTEKRDFFGSNVVPLTALAAWEGIGGGPTSSGELVNERTALAISTVYTCVTILAEGIASLPCKLMRQSEKGRAEAVNNPLYDLLAYSPNIEMTAFTFWSTIVGSAALTGNGYAVIIRDENKQPESIWPLHPLKTEPFRQKDGTLAFKTSDGEAEGSFRIIAAADVLHFPLFSFDGIKGLGPIRAARESFATARAMEKYGARFFANDATPPSVLIRKGPAPDPKVQAEIRESWKAAHAGGNQHTQGFLYGDWSIETVGLNPEDTQFIVSKNYTRSDIAAMFKIPPQMVGSLERMSNNNWTGQQLSFVTDTLRPITVRIEQEVKRKLLTGRAGSKLFVTFDVTERLKGDFDTQTKTLALGRQWGILTGNECRIELGYNPLGPEADVLIYPVNMANAAQLPGQANTQNIDEQPKDPITPKDPTDEAE
jgi:HK97 family phage portal protein